MAQSKKIGRWQGAGLLATTLLGTGVFILPQMTLAIAGQGAIISWLLLTLAIIPVTLVFAQMAAKMPHAAGPAYFVERAFGAVAGRTIGLMFLLVVPLGAPAAILMTFQFVDALVPLTGTALLLTELSVLLLLFALNFRGIHVSAKLQFLLTLAIVAVVVVLFGAGSLQTSQAINTGLPEMNIDTVMAAAGIAFWSFLGVEAMTHLANDFDDPQKDLMPAMMIGTVIVGLVYIACTQILVLVPTTTDLAMVGIFDQLIGGYGAEVIGVLGIAGGLAAVNVYTASLSRLVCSFSQDGVLPDYLAKVNQHNVPVRALAVVLAIMGCVLIVTFITGQNIEDLIAWCNGVFIMIYFVSMLAAFKLLSNRNTLLIVLGCLFCLMLMWGLGGQMIYAAMIIVITMPLLWWQHDYQTNKQLASQDAESTLAP
jgi:amino acid efflux transporter